MGASDFSCRANGKTAADAFIAARQQAQYDHGHSGYSGTIAEKGSFRLVTVPDGKTADQVMEECMADDNHFCQDKCGDAACIDLGNGQFLFFGWASS